VSSAAPILAACVLAMALALPAEGQQRGQARPAPVSPSPQEPPPEPAPPYEPQLVRLAEIMGSVAYLRGLCARPDAATWRERMEALIAAEGRSPQRRDRLAGAYNRGFRAYALTHRICVATSETAAQRLSGEGEKLARELAGRFGG